MFESSYEFPGRCVCADGTRTPCLRGRLSRRSSHTGMPAGRWASSTRRSASRPLGAPSRSRRSTRAERCSSRPCTRRSLAATPSRPSRSARRRPEPPCCAAPSSRRLPASQRSSARGSTPSSRSCARCGTSSRARRRPPSLPILLPRHHLHTPPPWPPAQHASRHASRWQAEPMLGLYGAFGYDLTFQFEPIRPAQSRVAGARDLLLYLPDELLVVDIHTRGATARPSSRRLLPDPSLDARPGPPSVGAWRLTYDFTVGGRSSAGLPRSGLALPYVPLPEVSAGVCWGPTDQLLWASHILLRPSSALPPSLPPAGAAPLPERPRGGRFREQGARRAPSRHAPSRHAPGPAAAARPLASLPCPRRGRWLAPRRSSRSVTSSKSSSPKTSPSPALTHPRPSSAACARATPPPMGSSSTSAPTAASTAAAAAGSPNTSSALRQRCLCGWSETRAAGGVRRVPSRGRSAAAPTRWRSARGSPGADPSRHAAGHPPSPWV